MIASTEIGSNSSGGPRVVMKPLSEVTFSASISMQFGETDIANEEETLSSCKTLSVDADTNGRMPGQQVQCIDVYNYYLSYCSL
jgi:hypothetical protein